MGGFEYVEATLDLTGCKDRYDLHDRLKTALQFPEHYGYGWDAFWDSLQYDCPVNYVRIVGESTTPKSLREDLDIMYELFQENKEDRLYLLDSFDFERVS